MTTFIQSSKFNRRSKEYRQWCRYMEAKHGVKFPK